MVNYIVSMPIRAFFLERFRDCLEKKTKKKTKTFPLVPLSGAYCLSLRFDHLSSVDPICSLGLHADFFYLIWLYKTPIRSNLVVIFWSAVNKKIRFRRIPSRMIICWSLFQKNSLFFFFLFFSSFEKFLFSFPFLGSGIGFEREK